MQDENGIAGGYLSRTGRAGSGNLGNAGHSGDRGLPPLPSASLLGEGREASAQAQADPWSRRRNMDASQVDPGTALCSPLFRLDTELATLAGFLFVIVSLAEGCLATDFN